MAPAKTICPNFRADVEPGVEAGRDRPGDTVMSNALRPDLMSADERLDEVAEILATGLSRLIARQSSRLSADAGESSLDCAADQSGHPNALNGDLGSDR